MLAETVTFVAGPSLIISVIVIVVAAIVRGARGSGEPAGEARTLAPVVPPIVRPTERDCPYCAERVKVNAIVCRFCNRDLPPDLSTRADQMLANGLSVNETKMLRDQYPAAAEEALALLAGMPRPADPYAWTAELCSRIKAGADGPAAAKRIPLNWPNS